MRTEEFSSQPESRGSMIDSSQPSTESWDTDPFEESVEAHPYFKELSPSWQRLLVGLEEKYGSPPPPPPVNPNWTELKKYAELRKAHLDSTPSGRAARAERERRRKELQREARPCFIRFLDPPPRGKPSSNYYGGGAPAEEHGLSVFRAFEVDGKYVVDPGEDLDLALALLSLTTGRLDPVYVVEGEEIGVGTANEPLLDPHTWTARPIEREHVESLWEFPASWRVGMWLWRIFPAFGT